MKKGILKCKKIFDMRCGMLAAWVALAVCGCIGMVGFAVNKIARKHTFSEREVELFLKLERDQNMYQHGL
jgi:hypothetical protein